MSRTDNIAAEAGTNNIRVRLSDDFSQFASASSTPDKTIACDCSAANKELDILRACLRMLEDTHNNSAELSYSALVVKQCLADQIEELERVIEPAKMSNFVDGSQRRNSRLTATEIAELMYSHSIKSWPVLIMSTAVLAGAVLFFLLQSVPDIKFTLGWVSTFAALVLLVLSSTTRLPDDEDSSRPNGAIRGHRVKVKSTSTYDEENFNRVIAGVEWPTLMFFFALFIVMEVMVKLGVIQFFGNQITSLVDMVPAGDLRAVAAITIILWSSGIAAALLDNVPFTTMMIKIIETIVVQSHVTKSFDLQTIKALVYALAFGACYGGNGTIMGAGANLVTVSVASNYGYPITFIQYLKFNAPIALISLVVANIYLILVFVVFRL